MLREFPRGGPPATVCCNSFVTVIAALELGDRTGFPWAWWYSEQTADGEFKKLPMDYAPFGIHPAVAKTMIDLIKAGRPLPPEFLVKLPIV